MIKKTWLAAVIVPVILLAVMCCKSTKETENIAAVSQPIGEITLSDIEAAVASQSTGSVKPIDIKSPGFFFMLKSWKKGTLLTLDGRARFAELSFIGKSRIKITALVDFPKERIDKTLLAAPESGICVTQSSGIFHVADIITKKTKSFDPFKKWSDRWSDGNPIFMDLAKGIIRFGYSSRRESDIGYKFYRIIYDAKNDKILYESPENGELITLYICLTQDLVLCQTKINDNTLEWVLYNWRTREIIRNDLIKTLNGLRLSAWFQHGRNINVGEQYLFGIVRLGEEKEVKITWDEDFENVKVIPIDYLLPSDKKVWFNNVFYLSANGKWATSFIGGYKGIYGDSLYKRGFYHLDSRYPNGISMPIFAEDYYTSSWNDGGAFVEHPVHGLCFAEEWHKREGGKDKQYLRLYKMDDVLAEINRQLWEVKK